MKVTSRDTRRTALLLLTAAAFWAGFSHAVSLKSRADYATGVAPYGVALDDFNGDGHLDVAVSNYSAAYGNTISVRLGDGSGAFGARTDYPAGPSPKGIATGDLNSDGKLDLVVANGDRWNVGSNVSVLLGNGAGAFGSPTSYSVAVNPKDVALADFDSDGHLDVATQGDTTTVSVLLGDGSGGLGSMVQWDAGADTQGLAVADVDGDGYSDIVTSNHGTTQCSVLLGNGDGTFDPPSTISGIDDEHLAIAVGDVNRDDVPDIAVLNFYDGSVSVMLGTGSGSFETATGCAGIGAAEDIEMADLNGDGQPDLLISNYTPSTISVFEGNADGSFRSKVDFDTAAQPCFAAVGDLTGDGKQDIAVAAINADSVCVFINTSLTVPNYTQSYFVPQSGSVSSPTEGTGAVANFHVCPNNDGGSAPNNARIKVVLRDTLGNPISGVAAGDICILFNGGTAAQGYSGSGADSVIANSAYNQNPLCQDVRCVAADSATNTNGASYITFRGATPGNPGVASRDSTRKWGHYDSVLPVYALGTELQGRLTSGQPNGSYVLQIKNVDLEGGLGTTLNQGEAVSFADYSSVAGHVGENDADDPKNWWRDFNSDGSVTFVDVSMAGAHYTHDCDTPNNP